MLIIYLQFFFAIGYTPCLNTEYVFSKLLKGLRTHFTIFDIISPPKVVTPKNATAYLSIVHPFMGTMYPSSNGYFQHDNAPCHKAISNWFHEHDKEYNVFQWPSQSSNPIEYLWDVMEHEIRNMNVQLTNLQKLSDAFMSTWNRIPKECFQHLVESIPVLRALPSISIVFLIKCSVSV